MVAKPMVFREFGALVVAVHSTEPPPDEDWNTFVQLVRRKIARERTVALAVTAGGAPNTKQRKAAQDLFRESPVRGAVVSDAALVRGVVTALGWFNPEIRGFPFKDGAGVRDALAYLGIEGSLAERVMVDVRAMQRELAG